MAMFGRNRDISLFRHINKELLQKIIETKVGYYKLDLNKTNSNIYGEAPEKVFADPVLMDCLIERGEQTTMPLDVNISIDRSITVRFLRDLLVDANLVPEIGDVLIWNEDFYEINTVKENQLILGKDPNYSYSSDTDAYGTSLSIIVTAQYSRPERFGLSKQRL
jgi:hypothetical protein